ncbi:hypothetical protein IHQ68_00255 [Chelatococcus sambhunathii]|uniref:Uncharacterized protein n=1 Tax=Chelatococcus sambhunathii TaxID=363953 RepID=A0ABU1DAB5_9HYPH|nr:hypothetical protein [Chelatococcus sambhunathii]MDR4305058.1 hypothetical protein [Chelatococcus sambhunathii]
MAVRKSKHEVGETLERLAASTKPRGVVGAAQARGAGKMMSVSERLAFADAIRSRTRPTNEDSTDLIRRDRDEQ